MKIVCDTNISVSAFLWSGIPNKIFKLALERKIEICGTFETFKEFERVINYPRLQDRIHIIETTPDEIIIYYGRLLTIYKETSLFETVVIKDPDDDIFISAALSSGSKIIVSRDKHLLEISNYKDIRIVNDVEFWKICKKIKLVS